jgi:hypothetical protein
LSEELVSVGIGASKTDEGRELATAETSAGADEVAVGVLSEEPLEELSSESSSELSEVSTGAEVSVAVAVAEAEPVRVMVVVQGVEEAEPAKVGSPVGSG